MRELISLQPGGTGTNIKQALEYFNHVNKKRSIAFIISDFIDEGYDQILRIISKKHDLIAVEIYDPREEELPDVGLVKLRDAETGEPRWIDTGDRPAAYELPRLLAQTAGRAETALPAKQGGRDPRSDRQTVHQTDRGFL